MRVSLLVSYSVGVKTREIVVQHCFQTIDWKILCRGTLCIYGCIILRIMIIVILIIIDILFVCIIIIIIIVVVIIFVIIITSASF